MILDHENNLKIDSHNIFKSKANNRHLDFVNTTADFRDC